MKPIKPKKMPKATEEWLSYGMEATGYALSPRQCRIILAALAYERKRAEDALVRAHFAEHQAIGYKPGDADDHVRHVEALRIHLGGARPSDFARVRAEVVTPECQREFTEAVVPKARRSSMEIAKEVAAGINADPTSPYSAEVDGVTITARQRVPEGVTITEAPNKRKKS